MDYRNDGIPTTVLSESNLRALVADFDRDGYASLWRGGVAAIEVQADAQHYASDPDRWLGHATRLEKQTAIALDVAHDRIRGCDPRNVAAVKAAYDRAVDKWAQARELYVTAKAVVDSRNRLAEAVVTAAWAGRPL